MKNLRHNCAEEKRKSRIDDYPYGGGRGAVMQADPLYRCWKHICDEVGERVHTIFMSPAGKTFRQADAIRLKEDYERLILVCGHYEGIDERFIEECVDEEISLGDFVLTGGEIAAMAGRFFWAAVFFFWKACPLSQWQQMAAAVALTTLCWLPFAWIGPETDFRVLREFCRKTGQYVPETVGEVMRCIYESLAMKYRLTLEKLEECTEKTYPAIHVIGGGTKDTLLCKMTACSCGRKVVAGPIEATVLGNILVQLLSCGAIADIDEARKIVRESENTVEYLPENTAEWSAAYERFKAVVNS